MQIRVSKTMLKQLQKHYKQYGYGIQIEELSPNAYSMCVDCMHSYHWADYNWETGKIKVFRVIYPSQYYANSLYLDTNQLEQIFQESKSETIEDFLVATENYILI